MHTGQQIITASDGVDTLLMSLRRGTGTESILMLHGVSRAARTFSSFSMLFPERYDIFGIDFRGHGRSGRADGRYRIVDYVRDAVAAVEAVGHPVILYGHSLGALVSAATAAQLPDLVRAVVLEDCPSIGFWQHLESTNYFPTFQAMRKWAGKVHLPCSEVAQGFGGEVLKRFSDGRVLTIADVRDSVSLRFTARCLQDLDPAVMSVILEGQWSEGYDVDSIFSRISCPVLIHRGEVSKGGMLPEEDARSLVSRLSDGMILTYPGAGHVLHWQVREQVALQTSTFLDSL